MLGCSYVGDGSGYTTGNVSHLTGQGGTFTAGMEFDFPYQQPCDNYIDQIGSNGGELLFRSQDNNGRVICYGGTGNSYRSIHATCVFGALRNGTSTKEQLMGHYMNYLTQTIGVQEAHDIVLQSMSVTPNPCYGNMVVDFSIAQNAFVDIAIYNSIGQRVRQFVHRSMQPGSHTIRWNGRDDYGRNLGSGIYVITVQVNTHAVSKTVVRLK